MIVSRFIIRSGMFIVAYTDNGEVLLGHTDPRSPVLARMPIEKPVLVQDEFWRDTVSEHVQELCALAVKSGYLESSDHINALLEALVSANPGAELCFSFDANGTMVVRMKNLKPSGSLIKWLPEAEEYSQHLSTLLWHAKKEQLFDFRIEHWD